MRRRTPLTTLLTTALLAGGALAGQTAAAGPAGADPVRCVPAELHAEAHQERDRADQLRRLGAREAAREADARADVLERRARQCADADRDNGRPLWK
ncbi:hypothetical protein AB0G79_15280 [Streptomyces sp. NPDC020807]|uniref:hypothetical protein n=1 Tax=Streptomyces sp. NPDC020807 TaxID=3155119 RepID=UPI0033C81990